MRNIDRNRVTYFLMTTTQKALYNKYKIKGYYKLRDFMLKRLSNRSV